jgi:cellulose synthase/poly-beta-1,6-N-acetylglucosamine synthase-like glycosyltransferase
MSDDGTREIVNEVANGDPRVRLVDNPERITPAALNRGLNEAAAPVLVRIDAHASPSPEYVERIYSHFLGGDFAGVGGVKEATPGSSLTSKLIAAALSSPLGVGGSKYHYASEPQLVDHIPFGAYKVDFLRSIGGWNPRALVNQDFELDYRIRKAGGTLLLDPAIHTGWKSSQTIRDFAHQYRRYGSGKALVAALHPKSLKLRHLAPVANLIVLAGSVVAVLIWRSWLPLLVDVPYVALLCASAFDRNVKVLGAKARVQAPFVFGVMHVSWGYGFIKRAFQILTRGVDAKQHDPFRSRDLSQSYAATNEK